MKPTTCESLIKNYSEWLAEKTTFADVGGACEITTPFLDRHNDRLQIYIEHNDAGYRLGDDGYILSDLESSGCAISTPSRRQLLGMALNGFGVRNDNGQLTIDATETDFPQKKHQLIQAMLAVNDMFMTAKPVVASLFVEDVRRFLDGINARYAPAVDFMGKSGYVHKFDYLITMGGGQPERLIRAINSPSKEHVSAFLFSWLDTKDTRPSGAKAYTFLNDEHDPKRSRESANSLASYGVKAVLWSKRQQVANDLAA